MNIVRRAITVFTLLLFFVMDSGAETQTVFNFTPGCVEAQKHIAALRLNKAALLLAEEKKAHPNNAAIVLLENSLDYYRIVTSQDFSLTKALDRIKDKRLEALKAIPASSPYKLYAQSEIHVQWAFIKFLKEEYVGAMFEFRSAYLLANENRIKYPDFKPGLKTVGMFKALLGTSPHSYKWILSVAGLEGDFDGGMEMISQYLKGDALPEFILDRQSAVFYYTLFTLNFGEKNKAWDFCEEQTRDYQTNQMSCYLRAYVGGKTAHNDEAIQVLQNRPRGNDYETFYLLDYLLGQCKLNRLDEDAEQYLKRFVAFYKGKSLLKDAYRRISWYYLLHNDEEKYKVYRELCKRYGGSGNEEDRNIQQEMASGISHDLLILRARLLFDGGYYQRAEETIKQRNPEQLKTGYQKLEYYYRYARILQEQNKLSKATELYGIVIKSAPFNTPYYFAPNACLQMGYIYQKLGFKQIARSHFLNVSNYKKAEYIQSIEIKAENELARLD